MLLENGRVFDVFEALLYQFFPQGVGVGERRLEAEFEGSDRGFLLGAGRTGLLVGYLREELFELGVAAAKGLELGLEVLACLFLLG